MRYLALGDYQLGAGYYDEEQRILYRWQGVVLPAALVDKKSSGLEGNVLAAGASYRQVLIDPPVDYGRTGGWGPALPGHYDRTTHLFYRWKGIWFEPANVKTGLWLGASCDLQAREKSGVIDIEVPAHRKDIAEQLRRTTMQPSTILSEEPRLDLEMARRMARAYSDQGPDGPVALGYVDLARGIYFQWKGVAVPREVARLTRGSSGVPGLPDPRILHYRVVEVDPPVDYLIGKDGLAEAGYSMYLSFDRWRDVRFDLSKISPQRLGILRGPIGRNQLIITDIDVPKHRREFAEELKGTIEGSSPTTIPTTVPAPASESVQKMGTRYVDLGGDRLAVGYYDDEQDILYRWEGVVLPVAHLGKDWRWIQRSHLLTPAMLYRTTPIDPPVDYLPIDGAGLAAPGYFDNTSHRFFRWKGIWFDPLKVKASWLGVLRDPEGGDFDAVKDINVPTHRKAIAVELAETTMQPSTLLSEEPKLDLETAHKLHRAYSVQGPGPVALGYVDLARGIYFKWKGVEVPREAVRLPGGLLSGMPDPAMMRSRVVEVDPPVDYVIGEDGVAEAGYCAQLNFYRWRNVRFDPSKISPQRLGILRRPIAYGKLVIRDIDVPEHRREFAEELKRTIEGKARESKGGK